MRLGISPADRSTPTGVFNQRFEALFPGAGALGCAVCFTTPLFLPVKLCVSVGLRGLLSSPTIPPGLFMCECGVAGSASCCTVCPVQQSAIIGSASHSPAASPLCPGCLCLPLLLVWTNVSSLSLWLLDFHTVLFSVSYGCFLFLNCCCPSFGCARRHSVSTYASILVRTPKIFQFQ